MQLISRRIALTLGAVVTLCSLTACGSSSSGSSLPQVSGAATPTITFPSSDPPSTLKVHVIKAGSGPVVTSGQLLVANYVGQLWRGKVFDSSFTRKVAAAFPIGVGHVIPGWDKGLVGQHAGSRVLLVVPPVDGYGPKGQPSAGITGKSTLVFVVDVIASYSTTPSAAAGTLHTTVDGITVTWPQSGPPTVHAASTAVAPKTLKVTVLSRGNGAKVKPGLVVLQYVVVSPTTNQLAGSTWKNGQPDGEVAGNPAAPSLLDKLVGIPLGSRVLLQLPKSSQGGPYVFAVELVAQPSVLG